MKRAGQTDFAEAVRKLVRGGPEATANVAPRRTDGLGFLGIELATNIATLFTQYARASVAGIRPTSVHAASDPHQRGR